MSDEDNKKPEESKNAKVQPEKRKTVRRLLTGGGIVTGAGAVGGRWTKPLVDSVLLPAHAQTSPAPATPSPTPQPTTSPTPQPTPSPTPLETLTPVP